MNKISDISANVFEIPEDIREIHAYTCEKWVIDPNSQLGHTILGFMVGIQEIVAEQKEAIDQLSEEIGIKLTKVNVEDIKHIDPAEFDDPENIAEKILAVLKHEARKLVATSDFLSDVRTHLSDCHADCSSNARLQRDIFLAQRVAGTSIKRSSELFRERHSYQSQFTISHSPSAFLGGVVNEMIGSINAYLPPDKQMEV